MVRETTGRRKRLRRFVICFRLFLVLPFNGIWNLRDSRRPSDRPGWTVLSAQSRLVGYPSQLDLVALIRASWVAEDVVWPLDSQPNSGPAWCSEP